MNFLKDSDSFNKHMAPHNFQPGLVYLFGRNSNQMLICISEQMTLMYIIAID